MEPEGAGPKAPWDARDPAGEPDGMGMLEGGRSEDVELVFVVM